MGLRFVGNGLNVFCIAEYGLLDQPKVIKRRPVLSSKHTEAEAANAEVYQSAKQVRGAEEGSKTFVVACMLVDGLTLSMYCRRRGLIRQRQSMTPLLIILSKCK